MVKSQKNTGKKKKNLPKKININNNNFIQVNPKRKNELQKNYDLNKVILIQKYFKKFLTEKIIEQNSLIIFIQKLEKIFLSKKFIQFKNIISKIKKTKKNKISAKKKNVLSININIYNTNKISANNTENSKIKEKESSYCRTTKHNKIMSYVNHKLNLLQENNTTSINNNLNNIKNFIPFSPKISATDRKGIPIQKIKFKNSVKKIRNKNPKNDKIIGQFNYNTLITVNDINSQNNIITNTCPNDTGKNITLNSVMENNNCSKFNNYKSNFSKISKIHRKGLSYNFDIPEPNYKEIGNTSKETNPNTILTNKNHKIDRSNAIKVEFDKIKKINTLFNKHKKINNKNNTTKTISSKENENCLYKDNTNKIKNKNKKISNGPKSFLQEKKTKTKKDMNKKNNNKQGKINKNNNQNKIINNNDIKKTYFRYWKENVEKKNILMKFAKFSKIFNHMNHYQKIILLKNTIQKLIKFQRKEDIEEFFWKIKKQILISVMKKLKEYKIKLDDINKIHLKKNVEANSIDKINQLKIVFSLLEKHKKYLNKNNSQLPRKLENYFYKWKNILEEKIPKINEKIIDLKTYQTNTINSNYINNSDNASLKKNLSQTKLSPKIINVINVQNYNQNNNYNYNFKYVPIKDIPTYPIKPRNSYFCSHNNLNIDNNNINNKVYHKKKLGNNYINTNYNFNINNKENMKNCFSNKFSNENNQKFDNYDTSSLILPFQSNNSEIISLEKNNIFYKDEHPEEKFGFKKLEQIEEKEINFSQNTNLNNNLNNNINNTKLYIKKQNADKKHIYLKNKTSNINKIKNSIKCLNMRFDNKNEEIIKREKNNLDNKLNKIFSTKNFFTEFNNYGNKKEKNNEDKMNKSFNADINTTLNEDFKITESNFKIKSPN